MNQTAKFFAITIFLISILIVFPALGDQYELTPNPNAAQNTIIIPSGDIGVNSANPFENFGAIGVESGGTLRNVGQMDILFVENSGSLSSVGIGVGGLLDVRPGSSMNFDSVSHFSVFGTVNNLGSISCDWSMQLAEGSQFNNLGGGVVNNKQGATFRGTFVNNGSFLNSTPGSGTGGYFQQIGDFQNQAGATMVNQGEIFNFTTLTNHGSISNEVYFNTGVGRGEFTNYGTVNNESAGTITNRQRWFNQGDLNNAGTFINHQSGIGMSNDAGKSINNLAGGTFHNDSSINSVTCDTLAMPIGDNMGLPATRWRCRLATAWACRRHAGDADWWKR